MIKDPKYPSVVGTPEAIAPGEMRLIKKMAGVELEALDAIDAAQATTFIQLWRLFPDDDPATLWEAAEWTQLKPEKAEGASPFDGSS
jgi:hypothetical protein